MRTTVDVDLTVLCGFGNEEKLTSKILSRFDSRISDPINFAISNRILLLTKNNVPIDVALSGLDYEEKMIANATNFEIYKNIVINTCSAEDLIVMKAFANCPKDWNDVQGIISRQGTRLDAKYIFNNLSSFAKLKEDASIVSNLRKCFKFNSSEKVTLI